MRRLGRQLLRVTGALMGAIFAFIMLKIIVSALSSGSDPIATWAVDKLDRVFRPVGRWFVGAPDWAWIALIMVLGFPAAFVLTWALDEAGIGIMPKHKPRWVVAIWVVVVMFACASIQWARSGHGY